MTIGGIVKSLYTLILHGRRELVINVSRKYNHLENIIYLIRRISDFLLPDINLYRAPKTISLADWFTERIDLYKYFYIIKPIPSSQ